MSITLTNGKLISINGVQQENDTVASVLGYSVDFLGKILTVQYATGSLVNNSLNVGVYGDHFTLTVNLKTGDWSATGTNGVSQSGNVFGPALDNFNSEVKTDVNLMEAFAAATFIPGVQVPWA